MKHTCFADKLSLVARYFRCSINLVGSGRIKNGHTVDSIYVVNV